MAVLTALIGETAETSKAAGSENGDRNAQRFDSRSNDREVHGRFDSRSNGDRGDDQTDEAAGNKDQGDDNDDLEGDS